MTRIVTLGKITDPSGPLRVCERIGFKIAQREFHERKSL